MPLAGPCLGALAESSTASAPALTNWQVADASFQKAAGLLVAKQYPQAQSELSSSATNLPAPYSRLAQQNLMKLEGAFNRAKADESARLDALSDVCMDLHAYKAAAQLKAAAKSDSTEEDSDDDLKAWRLFETGKFKEAVVEYQRKLEENQVSTFQEYFKKQIQLMEDRPKSLTNVQASLELVREHYLKGFEGKADFICALRELNRVLPHAQSPQDKLAIYDMNIKCLAGLGDEKGRDAWEEKVLRDFNSNADAAAELFLNRGIRAYVAKDYVKATELFRKVAREYPNSESFGDAQYNLGSTLQDAAKYDQAIEEFNKLFSSNVDDYKLVPGTSDDYRLYRHKAALRISECYEAKKDYARALDFAELARTQYKPLSWCHTCLQNSKEALEKRIAKLQELLKK